MMTENLMGENEAMRQPKNGKKQKQNLLKYSTIWINKKP